MRFQNATVYANTLKKKNHKGIEQPKYKLYSLDFLGYAVTFKTKNLSFEDVDHHNCPLKLCPPHLN